ncbi:UDP-glycosyltransferase 71D1 [Prunus yedoensis var. nudiflora]|uniref:UDP-glycosyltransferase 71D1 n=1 Tax=Prunus yedoensis var. nudiflora TaxID=2094558 RepID=A0A314ULS6_PRUYE|nr:UDP-glycosyltransferase 71D1 [Prunus yedoensis var. nudiflora]
MPSNAGSLAFMLHLPKPNNQITAEIKGSDPEIWSLMAASLLMLSLQRDLEGPAKGIVVNTIVELETHAIKSFSGGKSQSQTPPVYPVGSVIDLKGGQADDQSNLDKDQHDKIIKWLDEQPQSSVVFFLVCFGSMGSFGATQVKEIALGLGQSGQRFLWSLHLPPVPQAQGKTSRASNSSNSEDIYCHMGSWVGSWPTRQLVGLCLIVGGTQFWRACEQQLNAFRMVRELGLPEELRLDYRKGSGELVVADEIENGVTKVMDRNSEVRKKVKDMAEKVRKAAMDGGSSFISIGKTH